MKDGMYALPLTNALVTGDLNAAGQVSKGDGDMLSLSRADRKEVPCFEAGLSLDAEKGPAKTFTVNIGLPWSEIARACGGPQVLNRLVKWELVEVSGPWEKGGAMRFPHVNLVSQEVDSSGNVVLHLDASWPKGTGSPSYKVYVLQGRLSLKEQMPAWINAWSTEMDTGPEYGGKTLYLKSQLLGLFRDQVVAEAYLRIGEHKS